MARRRCPTCGSRQWHREPSSGLIACSEGHVLQDYRTEVTEADEMGPHALRKRTLKSGRKKKQATSKANPKLYHGARGRYHYFECLQLLLRKQVATLTRMWGLPAEFEIICRDVWALNLALLPDAPPAEPYRYAQALRDGNVVDIGGVGKDDDGTSDEERDDRDEDSDEDEDDVGRPEEDPELAALLRANSDIESSEEEEDEPPQEEPTSKHKAKTKTKGKRKTRGRHVYESPASTIAVLIVACWTMRIPALCRDFTRVIEKYELPYLDPVARHVLPASIVAHLTKHNIQALSPFHPPSTQVLHGLASRLSRLMHTTYSIFTPEANAGPILWRVVSQGLGGTPMLYGLTKRLGKILSLPLTAHRSLAPGLKKLKNYDPGQHIYDNVAPEVALISAGIVVLKMVYGLDGRTRVPQDAGDAACVLPRLDEYLKALGRLDAAEEAQNRHGVFDSRRSDVWMGDLDNDAIDEYLEFSERALIGRGEGDGLLDRYFPLRTGIVHEDVQTEGIVRPFRAMLEESTSQLRPGEGYRMFRSRDVEGTMCEEYALVIGRAGRWAGVPVEYLGGVVETYERRLVRWWDRERRSRD